ncbi:hypothetical protein J3F84DRAFT_26719 [Trichoderma pleuroticola]
MSDSATRLAEDDSLQFQHPRLNSTSAAERSYLRYLEQRVYNQWPPIGETRPSSHATIHDQAERESINQKKAQITSNDPPSSSSSSSLSFTRDNVSQRRGPIGNQGPNPRNKQHPIMPTEPNGGSHPLTPPGEIDRPRNRISDLYPENNLQYAPPPDMSRHQDFAIDGPSQGRRQGQYEHRNGYEPPPTAEDERINRRNGGDVDGEHAGNRTHHDDRSHDRTGGDGGHSENNAELNHEGKSTSSQGSKCKHCCQSPVCQDCKCHQCPCHYNSRCCRNVAQEMRELLQEMKDNLREMRDNLRETKNHQLRQQIEKLQEKVEAGVGAEMQFTTAGRQESGWSKVTQPSQLFMHSPAQFFTTLGPRIDHQSIGNRHNDPRLFKEVLPVPLVAPQPPRGIFDAGGDNHAFGSRSNKSSDGDKSSSLLDIISWLFFSPKYLLFIIFMGICVYAYFADN